MTVNPYPFPYHPGGFGSVPNETQHHHHYYPSTSPESIQVKIGDTTKSLQHWLEMLLDNVEDLSEAVERLSDNPTKGV